MSKHEGLSSFGHLSKTKPQAFKDRQPEARWPGIVVYHCPSRLLHWSSKDPCSFLEEERGQRQQQHQPQVDESFDDILFDVLNPPRRPYNEDSSNKDSSSCFSQQENTHRRSSNNGWRTIDWAAATTVAAAGAPPPPPLLSSVVETIVVRDRIVHIKRDDQLRLRGSQLSGNKARKMFALNQLAADDTFPRCIVSYGGPQSNAMLAIAAVVRHKKDIMAAAASSHGNGNEDRPTTRPPPPRFVYYTRTLPRFLKRQPTGNLYRALSLGMELVQVSSQEYHNLFGSDWGGSDEPPITLDPPVYGDSVWIPQGGACAMATIGLEQLAEEIWDFWQNKYQLQVGPHGGGIGNDHNHGMVRPLALPPPLTVVLPGGTGATALLLHRAIEMRKEKQRQQQQQQHMPAMDIQVAVVPCVGDVEYAERQMTNLSKIVNGAANINKNNVPAIVPPSPHERGPVTYFTFGEPSSDILETYQEMEKEHDLTLDLLYGAPTWTILLRHWSATEPIDSSSSNKSILHNRQLLYVHTGGLEGIGTQLLRYKYKGLLTADEVQLPLKVSETTNVDQFLEARGRDDC